MEEERNSKRKWQKNHQDKSFHSTDDQIIIINKKLNKVIVYIKLSLKKNLQKVRKMRLHEKK
jgi:hypothetical protein